MSSEPLLSASRLCFSYQEGRKLLDEIDLSLDGSRLTLLSGENGCGKSTLLKLLAGDLNPASGFILWRGQQLPRDKNLFYKHIWHLDQESTKQRIGICPRHDLEIWDMAFGQGQKLPGNNQNPDQTSWEEAARRFGLDPSRFELPYHQLSTGETRAVTLMPLIRTKSHFWLLDEPMAGLDSARGASFIQVCEEKLKSGVGMLIVTHTPEVFNSLPHSHLELREGKLWELV